MSLVQMHQRSYSADRVQRGEKPVFEFDLAENEEIVGVAHYFTHDYASRATVDHTVVVWVAVRL